MAIKIESAVNVNQILFCTDPQVSVGVVVDSTAGTEDEATGRTIVKAGTPLNGDLTTRNIAFVKAADTSNPAVGVLLHDVDVTDGDANGALLIFGFVNLERIDATTAALITATRKTELAGKVTFLK